MRECRELLQTFFGKRALSHRRTVRHAAHPFSLKKSAWYQSANEGVDPCAAFP